jgi:transcriptional regulator with XRE-family HTH domain
MSKPSNTTRSEPSALSRALRDARLNRGLSQEELASKLGVRQRQISDLERAAMDPRLSTVQNVARALDLELVLIPRHLISAVDSLQRAGVEPAQRPLYALGDATTESVSDDETGVGFGGAVDRSPTRRRGRRKEPR